MTEEEYEDKPVWMSADVQEAIEERPEHEGDSINKTLKKIFVDNSPPTDKEVDALVSSVESLRERIENLEEMANGY